MSTFFDTLRTEFPGALLEGAYISSVSLALGRHGFHADNTLACVGVCRDEICQPFVNRVRDAWGEAFNLSSLGALLFAGKTAFFEAMHHSPEPDGRRRYVFFHLPHVALGRGGEIGEVHRRGQPGASGACGALLMFQQAAIAGLVPTALDPDDMEQSLLGRVLGAHVPSGSMKDLLAITRVVHHVTLAQADRMIGLTMHQDRSDWAVLTGIQVHGPEGVDYVWPSRSWAMVRGERVELVIR